MAKIHRGFCLTRFGCLKGSLFFMRKYCHADLLVANAPHFYFSESARFLGQRLKPCPRRRGIGAADYPKQSDRALHRCVEARPAEASRSHLRRYIHCEYIKFKLSGFGLRAVSLPLEK